MRGWVTALAVSVLALLCLFPMLTADYPVDDGKGGNGFSNQRATAGTWTGGTIPDERSFIGWAQIYYETGHLWLPQANANAMQGPPGMQGQPPNGQPGQCPQQQQPQQQPCPPPGGKPPPRPPGSPPPPPALLAHDARDVTTQSTATGKYDVPQVSARITMDGQQGFANHWPAAQSMYLVPFYLSGTTLLATLLPLAGGLYAVWWLGRRWGGPWAGAVAAAGLAATGLVAMGAYSRFMADLPSACFLAIGMALVVRVADRCKASETMSQRVGTWSLAAAAGLALGFAILVRITAILALAGPAMFLLARAIQQRRTKGHTPRLLLAAIPAVLLLGILGGWLMWYNTTMFGSATDSGYGDSSSSGRSFDANSDDVTHFFTVVAPRLFAMAPLFIVALAAVVGIRKRWEQAALLVGWSVPVFAFYAQLGWIGRVGWEDMRYFLPALPAAAVAFGLAAAPAARHKGARWVLAAGGALFIVAAIYAADLSIGFQTARLGGGQRGPPQSGVPDALIAWAWAGIAVLGAAMLWARLGRGKASPPPPRPVQPIVMTRAPVAPGRPASPLVRAPPATPVNRPPPAKPPPVESR